ncbi:UV-endonuclease UvdE-domain-containing protein [Russula earlei]|uniref:UV-endonuclease UvdE-domain-containing protein n=1 Tax=Russula earlei TaxID=71964 RepID=A0ACC0UDX5_9AGAM|nr:UV-endonuclease UvdE-domain-containing protein [Russula earlei]
MAPALQMRTRSSRRVQQAQKKSAEPQQPEREESPLTESEDDQHRPKKRRRKTNSKVVEPVTYDIPPVESKTTTFLGFFSSQNIFLRLITYACSIPGRLGYACLNTVLRAVKPDPIFCSRKPNRTCRINTILKHGLDFAKDLGIRNTRDLAKLIQWNEDNRIRFMRISSELFPFASHDKYGYDLDYAAAELKTAGDLANQYGHRMTLHPGQFTQIGSPKQNVVDASVRELRYHCSILKHMGIGKDGVIVIHIGGVYGDKAATLARFKENYRTLLSGDIKERLGCGERRELDLPLVFDYHHDWIYPSSEPLTTLIPRINAIWHRKGIKPKQHLSSPRPGAVTVMEKRAHARRCSVLPKELDVEGIGWWWLAPGEREWMDVMIEAKDKEQAVFQLYRMYGLAPVIWNNLRPEKAEVAEDGQEEARSVRTRRKSKNRDNDEEWDLELPADVDPVTTVREGLEGPPAVEGNALESIKVAHPRRKPSSSAKGKQKAMHTRLGNDAFETVQEFKCSEALRPLVHHSSTDIVQPPYVLHIILVEMASIVTLHV